MKYFSLFSGIGGFELGIQQAYELSQMGTESKNSTNSSSTASQHSERPLCIGYSEVDKYAIQIYQKHFPNHKNYGDITKINTDELPDFDFLCGGFPCQAFSIAGLRRGFEDTRGTLFFEIARILQAKRPSLLLLENVKGLLSHDKGATFERIIQTLDELGYDLQWQVLNSKNFGVPQNRERVFVVGHLRGTSRPEVFPFTNTHQQNIECVQGCVSNTITARYEAAQATGTYVSEGKFNEKKALMVRDGRDNRSCLRSGRVPELGLKGLSIRRLTPKECERLQGFPDNWTDGVSDTQGYKCLGNAVTVNVIQAIMEKLI